MNQSPEQNRRPIFQRLSVMSWLCVLAGLIIGGVTAYVIIAIKWVPAVAFWGSIGSLMMFWHAYMYEKIEADIDLMKQIRKLDTLGVYSENENPLDFNKKI